MLDITDRDLSLKYFKILFSKVSWFPFYSPPAENNLILHLEYFSKFIYIYLKGCILFELNSIALKFIHIGFLSRQRQSIRKRKVQSVPNATISPFCRKIRKEETGNLLLLLFFPPLSNFFGQSCRNLNKPPPPSLLVFKRTDKEQEFLKNSRPHRAISLLFRIIVICANTFANTCIPLLEDKKTWGDKKTSVESENYSHAFLSSPSYLHCYLKKINSWSREGEGRARSSFNAETNDFGAAGIWSREKKEKKKERRKKWSAKNSALDSSRAWFFS